MGVWHLFVYIYTNNGGTASGNIGDYMQTLAMTKLLLKWSNVWKCVHRKQNLVVRLYGNSRDELPARRVSRTRRHLNVLYGWMLHPSANGDYAFPPRRGSNYVATSLHIAKPHLLDMEETCNFLKTIEPIGCRDLFTLRLVRKKGIQSFFSSCCTLTLQRNQNGKEEASRGGSLLSVEVAPWTLKQQKRQQREDGRTESRLVMCSPKNRLATVRQLWLRALCVFRLLQRCESVRSSRLHVYYPCLGLRTPCTVEAPCSASGAVVAVHGDKKRTTWGSPGRWESSRMYMHNHRSAEEDARKLESEMACFLGRLFAGEEVMIAWRKTLQKHVVYCLDANFEIPTLTSVNSLLSNNYDICIVLHLCLRDTRLNVAEVLRRHFPGVEIRTYECSEHLPYRSHLSHVSAATQDRLFVMDTLGEEVERCLYLDGDTLIRGSVAPLFEMSVPVVAARSSTHNLMATKTWSMGMAYSGDKSFNAGVMVLNLKALRKRGFAAFARKMLSESGANDQTVLNMFTQGDYAELSETYNFYVRKPDVNAFEKVNPRVLHYVGSQKPWSDGKLLKAEWLSYRLDKDSPLTEKFVYSR